MYNLYSVYQFLPDDFTECVRKNVPAEVAVAAFKHYTTSVAARMGITQRVIITDVGDAVALDWRQGEGIVFGLAERGPFDAS